MVLTRDLSSIMYKNKSEEFYIKDRNYKLQYAPLYSERLVRMRNELKKTAEAKWNNEYKFKNLVELEKNEKCIIIGTLYKEMKNKPNILKELAAENAAVDEQDDVVSDLASTANDQQQFIESLNKALNSNVSYIDESDQLILEDELQRIELAFTKKLKNNVNKDSLCTGLVVAFLGFENEDSKFEVEDFCFKYTEQVMDTNAILKTSSKDENKYILFLSGLELGDAKANENHFKLQLLIDFLSGDFINTASSEEKTKVNPDDKEMRDKLTNTVRLVIAGNSLSSSTQSKDMHNKAKYLTKNFVAGSVNAIKQLDGIVEKLSNTLNVDIMPGEFDPSNLMLPQQPLNNSMFTESKKNFNKSFFTATNPYRFNLNNVEFLGTSGQFINDIKKTTSLTDTIDIMKLLMSGGHLAPTCPDTLACYPYYGKDPFILNTLPNVFFTGNQPAFKHTVYDMEEDVDTKSKRVIHLLSIPSFKQTNSCVLLNINTFDCEEIFF